MAETILRSSDGGTDRRSSRYRLLVPITMLVVAALAGFVWNRRQAGTGLQPPF